MPDRSAQPGKPLQPLAGSGVLITRPRHRAAELEAAVAELGGRPVTFPVMAIEPVPAGELEAALAALHAPDIVIFVSPNAVGHGIDFTGDARVAAIGPATQRAVEAAGRNVDIVADDGFDSEHLLAAPGLRDVAGKVVRIIRGRSGRELLANTLRERGATVEYLAVYERRVPEPSASELDALESLWLAGGIDAIVVMSVESLTNLVTLLPDRLQRKLARTRLVTPASRVIKEALIRFPGIPTTLARGPQARDLADAIATAASAPPGRRDE